MIMTEAMDSVVTVVTTPSDGTDVELVAIESAKGLNAPAPTKDGDDYLITFNSNGQDGMMLVREEKGRILLITVAGARLDELMKVGKTSSVK